MTADKFRSTDQFVLTNLQIKNAPSALWIEICSLNCIIRTGETWI